MVTIYKKDTYEIRTIETRPERVKVEVFEHGKKLYGNIFSTSMYEMYEDYIKARANLLLMDCGKLHSDHCMVEFGNRMYAVDTGEYHRSLRRSITPMDYDIADDGHMVDLLIDSTLHDYFTYPKDVLVYKFENFYLNGKLLGKAKHMEFTWDVDLDFAYNIQSVVKNIEEIYDVQLKGYVSNFSDCMF